MYFPDYDPPGVVPPNERFYDLRTMDKCLPANVASAADVVFLTRRRSLSNLSALPAPESGTLFVHKVMSVESSKRKEGGKVAMHSISEDDHPGEPSAPATWRCRERNRRRRRLPAAPDRVSRRRPPQRHRIRTDDITHTAADRVAGKGNGETSPRRGDTLSDDDADATRERKTPRGPDLDDGDAASTPRGEDADADWRLVADVDADADGDGDADADGAWSVASRHPHASPRMSDFARAKNWRMPSRARRA